MSYLKSKKLKEYFLEFAMIFLAVILSFFAENYRGHLADNREEQQLIRSFVEDLKSDTSNIRIALNSRYRKSKMMDSLMMLLESKQIKGHENSLYFFGRNLIRSSYFQSNERTISKINNASVSDLIQNKEALNGIVVYRRVVAMLFIDHENERLEQRSAFPVLSQMFDPFVFDKMVNADGISRPIGNPPLRSYNPEIQQDLAFWVHQIKGGNFIIEARLKRLNERAKDLIHLLEVEYQLK